MECLLICVKYHDLDALLDGLPHPMPAGCTVISVLNGIAPLRRLRERLPHTRVAPTSVLFNGQMLGLLHVRQTTRAEVVISTEDAALLARFAGIGINIKQAPGDAAVWGKLLINLANAICALTRTDYRSLFNDPDLRRIYAAVIDEAAGALSTSGLAWKMTYAIPGCNRSR